MQLILLAAGKGTRLPKKLRNKPKCLVKVNNKTILDHNLKFYNYFKNKIIITGYKSKELKKFIKKEKFKEIKNTNYKKNNMVYSAFKCHKLIKSDVVICYSDIIFDHTLYLNLRTKKNIIPLKKNWLNIWKQRMSSKKIKLDAENVEVRNKVLFSIGQKIEKYMPKYQYMGILKLRRSDYHNLSKFFYGLQKQKISFTEFINLAVQERIVKINAYLTNKSWFEIDNFNDLKFAKRKLW